MTPERKAELRETLSGVRLYLAPDGSRQFAAQLAEVFRALDAAEARCERMRAVLATLEWINIAEYSSLATSDFYECPSCSGTKPGHLPGCGLAAALAEGSEGR